MDLNRDRRVGGRPTRARFALLLLTALVVAACSSSTGSSNPSQTTTSTVASAQVLAADQAIAKQQLLVLSDLPSGWTSNGATSTGKSTDENLTTVSFASTPELAGCIGVRAPPSVTAAEANSPSFNDVSGNLEADNAVAVYTSASAARADFVPLDNPKAPGCLAQDLGSQLTSGLQQALGPGTTVGQLTSTPLPFPKYGDLSGSVRMTAPTTTQGTSTTVVVDTVVINKGRSTSALMLISPNLPFPQDLAHTLAQKATAKMS